MNICWIIVCLTAYFTNNEYQFYLLAAVVGILMVVFNLFLDQLFQSFCQKRLVILHHFLIFMVYPIIYLLLLEHFHMVILNKLQVV